MKRKDSHEEINKNLNETLCRFGLEDDENLGLLNKVSQVMESHINISKKNNSHLF
jgi:hypothetical protein